MLKILNRHIFFAILADETCDISNKEQLSVCIRWIDEKFEIHEDIVAIVHVQKTDSESLYMELMNTLTSVGLSIENCRGQGYDGAAAMMGHLNGVWLQRDEPRAIPVHCFAHSLNVCLQDATKQYS